jgi:alanine dehydrogenase
MTIGVLKEIKPNEYRVAAVPATVYEIVRNGHEVIIQSGAGVGSGYSDEDYAAAGAKIAATAEEVWQKADLYYKVKELFPQEFKWMNKDKILFTYIHSNAHPEETDCLLSSGVSAVAYEDVQDKNGRFPLLRPMSELAGKGGFLAACYYMQAVNGGPGKLLANVAGVETPVITIIGCGNVGLGAAELAASFGNEVRILDVNMESMLAAKKYMPGNVTFMMSNRANLEKCLRESDVILNAIQWAKDRKDHIVYRQDLRLMKKGAIVVDVACDDGGAIETCRSTTHDKPVFHEEGVLHYCVDNIPSAFAQTASVTLANSTLPYLLQLANKGFKKAIEDNKYLRAGMTCYGGKLTLRETALKQNREWTDAEELIKVW